MVGFQEVILEPGQFIFGLKTASKELKMSIRTIRTCLDCLKRHQNLTIKSTNKFSIITVVNWGLYQSNNIEATSKRQASDKQATTNKNIRTKEHKKKTNKNTLYSFALTGNRDFKIDDAFFKEKQKLYPGVDLMLQFGRMSEWFKNNPQKKKASDRGIKNFITNWLKKEQDQKPSPRALVKKKPEYPKIVICNFCEAKFRLMSHSRGDCNKCGEAFWGYRDADGTWFERYPGSDDEQIKALTDRATDSMGEKK